jgi:hypothetical protein
LAGLLLVLAHTMGAPRRRQHLLKGVNLLAPPLVVRLLFALFAGVN